MLSMEDNMLSVGIDISKDKVDIAVYDGNRYVTAVFDNSVNGVNRMLAFVSKNINIELSKSSGVGLSTSKRMKISKQKGSTRSTKRRKESKFGTKSKGNSNNDKYKTNTNNNNNSRKPTININNNQSHNDKFAKQPHICFVMEATGTYYLTYANALYDKGCTVYVINPLIIKRYGEEKLRRAKTDKADAKLISEFGYYNIMSRAVKETDNPLDKYLFKPNSSVSIKVKLMLKTIEQLYALRIRNRNHIEALSQYKEEYSKESIKVLNSINKAIDKKILKVEKKIEKLIMDSSEYRDIYKRVTGIPGIGKRTGSALIGWFDTFNGFNSAKQVAAYIGLNPHIKQSGKSINNGNRSISRIGNPYLRKLFYMDALSASRSNTQCKLLYERLLIKGKDKPQILTAVGHKLLRQAFAIIKYNRVYDPQYGVKG